MAEGRIETDVCIVGAGYAGLTAARRLTQAGRAVVVVEARDRVGGRTWTKTSQSGALIDMGGAFVGPDQDRVHALAKEMGVELYPTYDIGDSILATGGKIRRYSSKKTPRISPVALASAGQAIARLDAMAKKVPLDAPWNAPKAAEWDAQTVASWLTARNVPTRTARDLLAATFRALFCVDLSEVSLLDALFLINSGNGLVKFMSIEGGYQENLYDGGAQAIPNRIAAELGDSVILSSPVRTVTQRSDTVEVECPNVTVVARHVVMSAPPSLAGHIRWDPPLAADRALLLNQMPAGTEIKTMCVYDSPFWRDEGLAGSSVAMDDLFEVTLDHTPRANAPGILSLFASAGKARRLAAMSVEDRRAVAVGILVKRFGAKAANPVDYEEQNWAEQEWSRGCSMAHFGTGVLTQYGYLLREPVGQIHWAGTETAGRSHGAMDGAVRSGERAAAEIVHGVEAARSEASLAD